MPAELAFVEAALVVVPVDESASVLAAVLELPSACRPTRKFFRSLIRAAVAVSRLEVDVASLVPVELELNALGGGPGGGPGGIGIDADALVVDADDNVSSVEVAAWLALSCRSCSHCDKP